MAGDAEYKQLLDVSRTLAEVAAELKKTNKDLESIAKSVSKDLPKEIKKVTDSQAESNKKLDKISSGKESDKKEGSKFSSDFYSDILAKMGISPDKAKSLSEKLANSEAKNVEKVKGALKDGGTVTEPGKYIVGENGAEVLNVPGGSKIIPLNVTDLLDGLNKISEIKKLINKDGVLKVDTSGGDKVLIGESPTDKYSLESIKKSIMDEKAENAARGIDVKGDAEKLTVLDSLNKKISEGSAATPAGPASTAENVIAKRGSIENAKLNDFYPSKAEIEEYKAKLIKEDPDLADDPEGLAYEINRFKFEEADRRYFEALKKSGSTGIKEETTPTLGTKESPKKASAEAPVEIKAKPAKEPREKSKFGEKIKSGLSKALGSGIVQTIGAAGGKMIDDKFFGGKKVASSLVPTATKSASSLLSKEASKSVSDVKSRVENKTTPLSAVKKSTPQPQASPVSQSSQSEASPVPSSAPQSQAPATPQKSESQAPASAASAAASPLPVKELSEMKALLANIARSLSGPLNVYNPDPFRPDSRRV